MTSKGTNWEEEENAIRPRESKAIISLPASAIRARWQSKEVGEFTKEKILGLSSKQQLFARYLRDIMKFSRV